MKDIRQELLSIFAAEHGEHVSRMRALLDSAAEDPAAVPASIHNELLRSAHTLKGAARAAGVAVVESLAHRMENLFGRAREGAPRLNRTVIAAVRRALDASEDAIGATIAQRTPLDAGPVLEQLDAALISDGSVEACAAPQTRRDPQSEPDDNTAPEPFDTVRVRAEDLDRLLRSSAQLLAYALGQAQISDGINRFYSAVRSLQVAVEPNGQGVPAPGARKRTTPLGSIHEHLRALASSARAIRVQQQRNEWTLEQLAQRLEQDVARVRMVSAHDVFDMFGNMVRDLAREHGKEVEFRAEGLDVYADRRILQALKDPLLHLFRNAVSHGIELPEERRQKAKLPAASISLRVTAQRGRLEATVEDDGRGIDFAAVKATAIRLGILSQADAGTCGTQELLECLMQPGFTTATQVTTLSGRGMGLSVVHEQVRRLQGEIDIRSKHGLGTSVSIAVPLSLATHHVALVSAARQTFAIPTLGIERLYRFKLQDLVRVQGRESIQVDGQYVPLAMLADLLGLHSGPEPLKPEPGEPQFVRAVLLRSGQERLALVVDEFSDERHAVVTDLGLPAEKAGKAAGGVVLEDGRVAIVLSPADLVMAYRQAGRGSSFLAATPALAREQASILVVDDSITTRALEKSILEAHGYRVRVAVDGIQALELLRAEKADAVIADLMMPRLDGFGLLQAIKKDSQLADIPVVIVSSIERQEDQERGLALGADAYILKQKFDQRELLEIVRQVL